MAINRRYVWVVLVYVGIAVQMSSSQVPWFVDDYEGYACKSPSGSTGVCKQKDDCRITLPNPAPVSEDENGRALCGSVGPGALVCCEDKPIDVTSGVTNPSVVTTPDVVTTPPATPEPPRTRVGEKSSKYCLANIPFNKQPWWFGDNDVQPETNEVSPWWEDEGSKKRKVPDQDVYWVNGGVQTYHREFPHMALLGYLAPGQSDYSWNCAGTLISDRFVLTARHCFADKRLRAPVLVRLGEYDLTKNDRTEMDYGIEKTLFHPQDKPGTWYHDLALIKLDREVKFNRAIRPACLSTKHEGEEREEGLIVTGWGSTAENSSPSQILLKGSAPPTVVSRNVCAKYYRSAKHLLPNGIHPGMLCAVDLVGNVDTCQGDSGGPIQLPTTVGMYVVVGVTTAGLRFCGDMTPSIYTRVSFYLDWIENIVWPYGV